MVPSPPAAAAAISEAARNPLLQGDRQQLAQPSHAAHPTGADASALEHLLGGRATMADDAGLFLEATHRMHPSLCQLSSDVCYDRRLQDLTAKDDAAIRLGWLVRAYTSQRCLTRATQTAHMRRQPE
jgi:uncharacterized protein